MHSRDAIMYEAAQVANAQRDLDARFKQLLKVAHADHPAWFDCSSDYCAAFTGAEAASGLVDYLRERA